MQRRGQNIAIGG